MFWDAELEVIRLRKELLSGQCDVRRVLLLADWQRLRSTEFWLEEAGKSAGRHPLLTAGLATAAGAVAAQVLRRPGMILGAVGRLGRLGRFLPVLLPVWKHFYSKSRST